MCECDLFQGEYKTACFVIAFVVPQVYEKNFDIFTDYNPVLQCYKQYRTKTSYVYDTEYMA